MDAELESERKLTQEEIDKLCEENTFDLYPGGTWARIGILIAIIASIISFAIVIGVLDKVK